MLLRCSSAPILGSLVSEADHDCSPFSTRSPLLPSRLSCKQSLPSMRRVHSETELRSLVYPSAEAAQQQHLSIIQEMEDSSTSFSDVNTPCLEKDGSIFSRKPCLKHSHPSAPSTSSRLCLEKDGSIFSRKPCLKHSDPSAPSTSSRLCEPCADVGLVRNECEQFNPLLLGHGISILSKPEDLMTNVGGGFHSRNGGGGGSGGSSRHNSNPQGDSNATDLYYQRLLESDPQNPLLLRNYAEFLRQAKHDFKKAEEYYERAILACPFDGEVLSKYAQHVWDVHKDSERAGTYFDQAVNASPDNCYVLASHASFLWESDESEEDTNEGAETTFSTVAAMPLMASA